MLFFVAKCFITLQKSTIHNKFLLWNIKKENDIMRCNSMCNRHNSCNRCWFIFFSNCRKRCNFQNDNAYNHNNCCNHNNIGHCGCNCCNQREIAFYGNNCCHQDEIDFCGNRNRCNGYNSRYGNNYYGFGGDGENDYYNQQFNW